MEGFSVFGFPLARLIVLEDTFVSIVKTLVYLFLLRHFLRGLIFFVFGGYPARIWISGALFFRARPFRITRALVFQLSAHLAVRFLFYFLTILLGIRFLVRGLPLALRVSLSTPFRGYLFFL